MTCERADAQAPEQPRPRRARGHAPDAMRAVDPIALEVLGVELGELVPDGELATAAQIAKLHDVGVRANAAQLTKAGASALLDRLAQRRSRGLCTCKQAQLARRGLNPHVSFELARLALDAIVANDWHTPESLRTDPRFAAQPATSEATA